MFKFHIIYLGEWWSIGWQCDHDYKLGCWLFLKHCNSLCCHVDLLCIYSLWIGEENIQWDISLKDENVSTVIHLSNSLLKLLAGLLLRKSVMQTRGFCWLVTMNSLQWSWEYLEDFLWQLLRMAETSSARCVQVSYYILRGMMIYWLTMWSRLQTRLLVIFKAL